MQHITIRKASLAKTRSLGRSWLQFSISGMLITILLVSLPLGWFAQRLRQKKRERAAVARLNDGVHTAFYFWENHEGQPPPPGPQWLRSILGDDFFADVDALNLIDRPATDADLELFDDLKGVRILALCDWSGARITDAGLSHCKHFTSLERFTIYCPCITDDGLACLENMHKLKHLHLWGARITDAGLKRLRGLTQLEELNLSYTLITDAGMRHISELGNLRVLRLKETQISDASISCLARLRELQMLNLDFTNVSEAGVAELRTRLPQCYISAESELHIRRRNAKDRLRSRK